MRSSTLPSTTHASADWPNAIAQPIDESCDCRPVRFRDITITPAPPGVDLRHATTPLLGEATNPIDAAIAATPARLETDGPNSSAPRTPSHGCAGTGAVNRREPTGASACPNAANEVVRVSRDMRTDWVNFASTRNPGWASYDPNTRSTGVYTAEPIAPAQPQPRQHRQDREVAPSGARPPIATRQHPRDLVGESAHHPAVTPTRGDRDRVH